MVSNYFIDESGHSGDLAKVGARADFGGQPFFTLACGGVDDEPGLDQELSRLKALHRVQGAEPKASSIAGKPALVADLLEYVSHAKIPVLIEAVDKRHLVGANIVEHHVLPPVGLPDDPATMHFKRLFADYLGIAMPDDVVAAFVGACLAPSRASVRASLGTLEAWLNNRPASDELAHGMVEGVTDTASDCDALEDGDDGYLRFLPSPDDSLKGKPYWMLPNQSCFTNIYARLNLKYCGNVSHLTLHHDETLAYQHILEGAKKTLEALNREAVPGHIRHADYRITQSAKLAFVQSHKSPGVQLSDVLAGFVMRRMKSSVGETTIRDVDGDRAFDSLMRLSDPAAGQGINFVASGRLLRRMGIRWT